ncbi:MAG: SUMF1/EgtB/PvdO family nonheme iron enzyme, partial [Lachnospiraceae bacterium]|nr:SUMF1/EgtB/PvdO family nonheme iron enzyme [Lachnospiraceae bacterium]
MQTGKNNQLKRVVDFGMPILLLCLMSYQVMGEALHEWIGMGMTVLVILHQILNHKWYGSLFKGKYHAPRILMTVVNLLLVASFILTAFCGMSMSGYAVPFLYGMAPVSFVRRMHLSMSHWSFVLMGIHVGIHMPVGQKHFKWKDRTRNVLACALAVIAGTGLYLFLKSNMSDYLFFRVPFAFLDYGKAAALVFLENILMLLFWAFIGMEIFVLCKEAGKTDKGKKNPLLPVCCMMAAVIIGLVMWVAIPGNRPDHGSGIGAWDKAQKSADAVKNGMPMQDSSDTADGNDVIDAYILIDGGTFLMGSPETENWRVDDETQHEVTVSTFYIDPYETAQGDYEQLMGVNPSTFTGENLPVENISWFDAVQYANKKSEAAGLSPAYTITKGNVSWDRSANGYRLPTEAEWEYACRAGTTTPFNTEKSLSAQEANFYGHYPYEIEENYFNDSVLEARPGEYRQTTLEVGSFEPNAWGLYDCHGNVNEWCWDYY